jgi:hypothetical protein
MRRENDLLYLSPPRGERSSEARVRGPLRDSERRNSAPSGEVPAPHPLPARGERESLASRERFFMSSLRAQAKQSSGRGRLRDCFVATLLAMTVVLPRKRGRRRAKRKR